MRRDDAIPDVRDGLTRLQRVTLWQLSQLQRERGGRRVPTTMLYGRVCEHVCVDPATFQRMLAKLVGRAVPSRRGHGGANLDRRAVANAHETPRADSAAADAGDDHGAI